MSPRLSGRLQIEQDDVDAAAAGCGAQAVGEGAHDLERERLVADQRELLAEQLLVLRVRVDQQHGRIRHAGREYIAERSSSDCCNGSG